MEMPDPASFKPFAYESHMPPGTAPTQLYRMVKAAYDSEDFTIDGFADALIEYEEAIQIMSDLTEPTNHERHLLLTIAQGAKAYRAAKASLMAARAALRQILPPNRAHATVLNITKVIKPYQKAKAALLAAQEALADAETGLSQFMYAYLCYYFMNE